MIHEEVHKIMKQNQPIYRYDFILSRGLFYDGEDQTTKLGMVNLIDEMWDEQGPDGYDVMQIYASKNTSTKDPVVALELQEAVVLFSTIKLSESVAIATAKRASLDKVIQPSQVVSYMKLK